ncbi:hypothetical protein A1A1_01800 [Planococcus antarcticus DSM 14505]|uniref:Uncharacterized protein n=1 Tax=Planococcus antarcticus DSM 14505 TaxID=1185653 RepID=A0AA87IP69_9BACL|nr:hypothetical protein [Planococcus antarcticus]EIM08199.1 hypothetical protein A1A1_01800 [Planococcus antarcticus DSM 14505]
MESIWAALESIQPVLESIACRMESIWGRIKSISNYMGMGDPIKTEKAKLQADFSIMRIEYQLPPQKPY